MRAEQKISTSQLMILVFLSHLAGLLLKTNDNANLSAAESILLNLVVFGVVYLLFSLLSKPLRRSEKGILELAKPKKALYAALNIAVIAGFAVAAAYALRGISVFVETVATIKSYAWLFQLFVLALVFYALSTGIEGVARFGFIVFCVFFVMFGIILAANYQNIDITNLRYMGGESPRRILRAAPFGLSVLLELFAVFLLHGQVADKQRFRPIAKKYLIAMMAVSIALVLFQELICGYIDQQQLYTIYTIAALGQFSILQRLDVFYQAFWILASAVRLFCFTLVCAQSALRLFPKIQAKYIHLAIVVLLFLINGLLGIR